MVTKSSTGTSLIFLKYMVTAFVGSLLVMGITSLLATGDHALGAGIVAPFLVALTVHSIGEAYKKGLQDGGK